MTSFDITSHGIIDKICTKFFYYLITLFLWLINMNSFFRLDLFFVHPITNDFICLWMLNSKLIHDNSDVNT